MARPKFEVKWNMVDAMLRIQCSGEEIASVLGCSYDTIERSCKSTYGKSFADYSAEKRHEGRVSLRRMQWKTAEGGNVTMQIFLGKNMLGQTDKVSQEVSGPDGGPVETKLKITVEGI